MKAREHLSWANPARQRRDERVRPVPSVNLEPGLRARLGELLFRHD